MHVPVLQEDDMAHKTACWHAADILETKEDIAAYLNDVLEDGDPDLLKAALSDIARAKVMTEIALAARLRRISLVNALSPAGNPEFATVAKVLRALGLWLTSPPEATAFAGAPFAAFTTTTNEVVILYLGMAGGQEPLLTWGSFPKKIGNSSDTRGDQRGVAFP